ncbi:hypothetical protein RHS03_04020, partial [Rhizoctonia solani]
MNIASPPSAHFPLEIFSVIISFTSDPGTLCSLARCCRAFTRSAEFYLYDTLKFAPGLKAIQLARALVRSSRRSSYVRDASVELVENAIQPILLPAGIKLIIRAIVGFTVRPVQLRGVAPEPEPHLAHYALPFLSSFTGRLAQAVSVLPGRPVTSLALNGSVSLSEFESALPVLAQTSAQIESLALQTGELSSRLFTLLGAHIPTLTRLELRIVRPAMVAYSNLTSESVCQAMSLLPGMRHFGLRLRCPQLFGALWFHTQRDVVLDWKEHCPNLCEVTFESSSDDKVMEWAFDEEAMDWGCSLDEDN